VGKKIYTNKEDDELIKIKSGDKAVWFEEESDS